MKDILVSGFVCVLLLGGCMTEDLSKTQHQSDFDLFQAVRLGENRRSVEGILGRPILEEQQRVYYLGPPLISKGESPVAPGTIMIKYSDSGIVVRKAFYGKQP